MCLDFKISETESWYNPFPQKPFQPAYSKFEIIRNPQINFSTSSVTNINFVQVLLKVFK